MRNYFAALVLLAIAFTACEDKPHEPLPILGRANIVGNDTMPHHIMDFRLLDQDSSWITNEDLDPYIYLADFFFTSCPTMCPKVKKQMMRIDEKFAGDDRIRFLCHSIDYIRDSVPRLRQYRDNLELDDRWHLVEVSEDFLDSLTANYLSVAYADESAPGGFDHTGNILLVDRSRHIRAFALGTDPEDVDQLIIDIQSLLDEEFPQAE